MKRCFNCGELVSDKDWDHIGHQRVYICGSVACDKEVRDGNRAVQEWQAKEDGYEKYW